MTSAFYPAFIKWLINYYQINWMNRLIEYLILLINSAGQKKLTNIEITFNLKRIGAFFSFNLWEYETDEYFNITQPTPATDG